MAKDTTAATRQKRRREKLKEQLALASKSFPTATVPPSSPRASATNSIPVTDHAVPALPDVAPLHDTTPSAVGAPGMFETVLSLSSGDDASGDVTPDANEAEPFVPPVEEPKETKPPLAESDVALVAMAILGYWKLGSATLLVKFPEIGALASGLPPPIQAAMASDKIDGFIYQAAIRCAIKYRVRVPYQDELVVVGALGVASFGLFGKRPVAANEATSEAAQAEQPEQPIGHAPSMPAPVVVVDEEAVAQ